MIDDVRPSAPHAGYRAKTVVGEVVPVSATIFKDGHDILAARALLLPDGGGRPLAVVGLEETVNDVWAGSLLIPGGTAPGRTVTDGTGPDGADGLGARQLVVEAWTDGHATWAHKVEAKLGAAQEVGTEIQEGIALLGTAHRQDPAVVTALAALRDGSLPASTRVGPALSAGVAAALSGPEGSPDLTRSVASPMWIDRERALVGAWYELFPRSFGGLRGVARRVPAIAAMGFDVLYLPPVHPIGRTERKGRNNTLGAGPADPGSPWGIGSAEGGHTAIHPDLGTIEDFHHLVSTLAGNGMELALDYALQCSPDHPWVHEHPEWFHHRPDGSIAYAENPPKKYQDIYPINFWPERDGDRRALWDACREILDFWIEQGVRIFRVDNPIRSPSPSGNG